MGPYVQIDINTLKGLFSKSSSPKSLERIYVGLTLVIQEQGRPCTVAEYGKRHALNVTFLFVHFVGFFVQQCSAISAYKARERGMSTLH